MAWGDKGTWGMGGYDQSLTGRASRRPGLPAGVVLFDTAEIGTEAVKKRAHHLGALLAADPAVRNRGHRDQVHAEPMEVQRCTLRCSRRPSRNSCQWLGIDAIDLYQIMARFRCAPTTHWLRHWRPRTPRDV